MCVQEEITQGVVSLSVETGKMTADLLQKAVKKVLEEMQKKPSQRSLHQGKQTPAPAQTAWGLPDQHRDHGAEHQGVFGGGEEV